MALSVFLGKDVKKKLTGNFSMNYAVNGHFEYFHSLFYKQATVGKKVMGGQGATVLVFLILALQTCLDSDNVGKNNKLLANLKKTCSKSCKNIENNPICSLEPSFLRILKILKILFIQ